MTEDNLGTLIKKKKRRIRHCFNSLPLTINVIWFCFTDAPGLLSFQAYTFYRLVSPWYNLHDWRTLLLSALSPWKKHLRDVCGQSLGTAFLHELEAHTILLPHAFGVVLSCASRKKNAARNCSFQDMALFLRLLQLLVCFPNFFPESCCIVQFFPRRGGKTVSLFRSQTWYPSTGWWPLQTQLGPRAGFL